MNNKKSSNCCSTKNACGQSTHVIEETNLSRGIIEASIVDNFTVQDIPAVNSKILIGDGSISNDLNTSSNNNLGTHDLTVLDKQILKP